MENPRTIDFHNSVADGAARQWYTPGRSAFRRGCQTLLEMSIIPRFNVSTLHRHKCTLAFFGLEGAVPAAGPGR
jgi:hypothetical protein